MTLAPRRFGSRLKAERESRGLSLAQVSATTKIPVTLLEALEREDLSRWPKGLYRRSFFRSYVTALGLPPDPLAEEFARVHPEDGPPDLLPAVAIGSRSGAAPQPLALTLAEPTAAVAILRVMALALLEAGLVAAAGAGVAMASGMTLLAAIGAVALVYYPVARVMTGRWRRVATRLRGQGFRPAAPTQPAAAELAAADLAADAAAAAPLALQAEAPGVAPSRPEPTSRAGDLYRQTMDRWSPRVARVTSAASRVLSGGARILTRGTAAIGGVSSRAIDRTSLTVRRGSAVTGRLLGAAAGRTRRVSARGLRWASYAFWGGVRTMAEQAQLLASRQLNRSRE